MGALTFPSVLLGIVYNGSNKVWRKKETQI